jgi:hypothetical protein
MESVSISTIFFLKPLYPTDLTLSLELNTGFSNYNAVSYVSSVFNDEDYSLSTSNLKLGLNFYDLFGTMNSSLGDAGLSLKFQ